MDYLKRLSASGQLRFLLEKDTLQLHQQFIVSEK